jgi:hypothetical protein
MGEPLPAGQIPLTVAAPVGEPAAAPETERPQPVLITPKGRLIDDDAIDRAVAKAKVKAIQRAVDRAKRRDQLRLWRSSR